MKLGAEPRKVALLVVLMGLAAYLFYRNLSNEGVPSGPAPNMRPGTVASSARASGPQETRVTPAGSPQQAGTTLRLNPGTGSQPQELDPLRVDPRLPLEMLERVRHAEVAAVHRNLFDFGAPPPRVREPKIVPAPVSALPKPPEPAPMREGVASPPSPPVPLKYYGFVAPQPDGARKAFFLEGEEIFVAGEGDVIRKRYKVVRISPTSAEIEDLESHHRQTLRLEELRG